jgi:manganese-dependent inorganic pyrophosphatase
VGEFVYVIGHRKPDTDSVCSAIAYAHLMGLLGTAPARPARAGAINAETEFVLKRFSVPVPELLSDAAGLDLVLVDHNEIAQALPNIERANVLEIWEHHRLGDLRPPAPIVVHCEPVGATATLIAERYFTSGISPSRGMAGLLVASILSDTVGFRSPTTSEKDRDMAARLAPIAGVDLESFGLELLRMRTADTDRKPAAALVGDDLKEFRIGDLRVGVAQVETARPGALAERKEEILLEMETVLTGQDLALLILMITDVGEGASDLWAIGSRVDLFESAFGPTRDGTAHLPGCMSRKKQVVPKLEMAAERCDAPGTSGP